MMLNPRIGGPNAVTWPAFWVVLAVSALANLSDPRTTWTLGTSWRNLLCQLIAAGAMFAVMWALRGVLLRHAAMRPRPWRAVFIFATGAVVRALVLAAVFPMIGFGDTPVFGRVLSSLLVGVPLLMITASVVDLVRTSAAQRADLRVEAEALQADERKALHAITALQEGAFAQVRRLLAQRLDSIRAGGTVAMGESLRRDVDEVIRPMSHRMAHDDAAPPAAIRLDEKARIGWRDVLLSASLGNPFRPALTAAILAVGSATTLMASTGGAVRGLGYAVVLGLLGFGVFTLLDRMLTPRTRRMGAAPRTATFLAAAIAGVLVVALLLGWVISATGGAFAWRIPIAVMIVGPFIVVALSIEQGFRQQAAATDADLAATNAGLRVASALASAALWHEERRLSRALHGPVQAAVTVAAMRMEAGDGDGAAAALVEALGHLDLREGEQRRVADALASVARVWAGLCEVSTDLGHDVEERLAARPAMAASFIDICTEACSNAVRHGGARHVTVQAACDGDAIALKVEDDGVPMGAEAPGGLGSALLDDVTLAWDRRREGNVTVLAAWLPSAA